MNSTYDDNFKDLDCIVGELPDVVDKQNVAKICAINLSPFAILCVNFIDRGILGGNGQLVIS